MSLENMSPYVTWWKVFLLQQNVSNQHVLNYSWFHPLCSLKKNLEILGSSSLQVLHLACSKEPFLDGRLARHKRTLPPGCLPFLRSRGHCTTFLVLCIFTRQIQFNILQNIGLASIAPQPSTHRFSSQWYRAIKEVTRDYKKQFTNNFGGLGNLEGQE